MILDVYCTHRMADLVQPFLHPVYWSCKQCGTKWIMGTSWPDKVVIGRTEYFKEPKS